MSIDLDKLQEMWEKEGWNYNRFKVSNEPDKLLWHCVYSDTIRISMGFNNCVNFDKQYDLSQKNHNN